MENKKIQEIIYKAQFNKIDFFVIFLVVFAFLIRIAFLFYLPIRGWDETVYLNLAHELSENPLFYSLAHSGWNDFIPSTEIIYGWPNVGFRAPLLPYLLSILYFLNLNLIIEIVNPLFGALSVFLIYIFGKKLFNKEIGLYSAILFSLIPIHIYFSGQVLTDTFVVFFILLTFISFWEGYEKNNKKYKILFGLFLALSLLARYTTLWIIPVFFFYFIIRDKSLKFLKDKYFWFAIGVFLIILMPWFIYGLKYYGNILGPFLHGFKAAGYWGGVQSWKFFFVNSWSIFSITGILFLFSLFYLFFKKEFIKRELYLLLIWTVFFLGMTIYMPHKEERFIMPIVPAVCMICAVFVYKFKKYKNVFFGLICLVLVVSFGYFLKNEKEKSHNKANICFVEGNKFLTNNPLINENSLIITNQSPIVYYYSQKENQPYPDPWSIDLLRIKINSKYKNREVYIFFSNYDMMNTEIKEDLNRNFQKVFECSEDWGYSAVYKYK